MLSKVLVISWEKHSRTRSTDLVWLRRISLLEDTSIEERNSSCRKCNRTSWDVKSIFYGTYLILAKKQEIRRWKENTSFERRDTSHKRKFVSSEMWETRVTAWQTTCISLETKKKDIRGKRETRPCEKRETRNETYVLKNGTSQEMYGISRETWRLTSRKLGNFTKIQSKNIFFSSDGRVASPDTQEHYFASSCWKRRKTSWTGT